jgi:hypothetical protein
MNGTNLFPPGYLDYMFPTDESLVRKDDMPLRQLGVVLFGYRFLPQITGLPSEGNVHPEEGEGSAGSLGAHCWPVFPSRGPAGKDEGRNPFGIP